MYLSLIMIMYETYILVKGACDQRLWFVRVPLNGLHLKLNTRSGHAALVKANVLLSLLVTAFRNKKLQNNT